MRKFLSLIALAALPLTAADAGVISINLTDGGPGTGAADATEIGGVVEAGYWNTVGPSGGSLSGVFSTGTNASNLKDDAGANSGVSLSSGTGWNGGFMSLARTGYNTATSNKVMENNIQTSGSTSITFSNISYASYDVYILSGMWGNLAISEFTIGSESEYIWGGLHNGPFTEADHSSAAAATAGGKNSSNYVRFEGVTGSSFTLNVAAVAGGDGTNAIISGIQIVETQSVPEPGTMTLAGLGALCMLRRRRH